MITNWKLLVQMWNFTHSEENVKLRVGKSTSNSNGHTIEIENPDFGI